MANYSGDPKKLVSSSYLFTEMQNLFNKVKKLLDKKSDKGHTHNSESIVPIMSKTYTGIRIDTKYNFKKGTYYFGTIKPDNYDFPWRIKYKINGEVPNYPSYSGTFEVELCGNQSSRLTYKIFNTHTNTGSRSLNYHVLFSCTKEGILNNYGHLLGIDMRDAPNADSDTYKRNFTIEILEVENCSFSFFDSMSLYSTITTNPEKPEIASYYPEKVNGSNCYTEYDGNNNGLRESGDDTQYSILISSNMKVYAGSNKIFPYTIIMEKADGKWESTVLSNSNKVGKNKNTSGFRLGKMLLYYNRGDIYNAGSLTANWCLFSSYSNFDFRYSSNCDATLLVNKPVYLKGTIENELFYLDNSIYCQTLPTTDDGFAYIYIGEAVATTHISFEPKHPIYIFKNGRIQNYVGNAQTVNGHTVKSDVPVNAKFTDTTYTTVTPSKSGLMSYEDKIKLDTIETGANNYELPEASATEMGGIQLGYSQTGKKYPVQLEDGKAYVEVPWSWRGIQDNLTSASTTDSLSANQGRELKRLIDAKAPSSGSTSISKLASTITLGDGASAEIYQNSANYQQKIKIVDNSTSNDAVFQFQQSKDAGANFTDLMTINDDGTVVANTFSGDLEGTALNASQLNGMSAGGKWGNIPFTRLTDGVMEIGKIIDFHNDAGASKDYDARITSHGTGLTLSGTTKGTFEGNLAGTASKATSDAKGQNIANTYVKDIIVENNTLKMTNGAGTTADVMELYTVGTASNLGLTKLYTETGTNTDGSMTQNVISNALKTKSNANHNHDSSYLSLANGGTVQGNTAFTQGTYVTKVGGQNSTASGYLHLATLTINNSYVNSFIELEVSKRTGYGQIYIRFANANNKDPSLENFFYNSICNIKPVLVKTDTSIWDLYIKTTETYDHATVVNYYSDAAINVTLCSGATFTEDIGEDFVEATLVSLNQNIKGNATTATKATQDSAGQQINTTYIKGLSVSGKTITYTKGDGTTGTITTQDTNTTYGTGTATTAGLTKLYTSTGSSTDGTMTRKAITDALATKSNVGHTHTANECGALDTALKGVANGVAELDSNGKVPASQLPSYVDDVVEGYLSSGKFYSDSAKTKLITGETSKIYVDLSTNKTYRWSGSAYTEISASLALGETSSTAYRGDRGKIAYTHSQSAHAPSNAEKNIVVGIQKNGTDLTVDSSSRKVNITVPTKVSELENDSNFQSTVYTTGTPTKAGITKLYTEKGTNTDGAMTQNAVTTELTTLETALNNGLAKKSNVGHTHTKNEIMDFNKQLNNEDLNSITEAGFYYAGGGNKVTNKPSEIDAFGLEVIQSAAGWYTQKCYASNNQMKEYIRWYMGGSWSSWTNITVTADHTHNYLPLSGGTLTGTLKLSDNNYIQGTMSGNDCWRIKGDQTATDSGYLEIATTDNGNEPIYVRQYSGSKDFSTLKRTATLLDASGNTSFPGKVTANSMQVTDRFIGNLTGNADTATKATTCTGNAATATKLQTARKINNVSFDGTTDINIHAQSEVWYVGSDLASSNGWYKIGSVNMCASNYKDSNLTLLLTSTYEKHQNGIIYIHARRNTEENSFSTPTIKWMYRYGFNEDSVAVVNNEGIMDIYVYIPVLRYDRIACRILDMSGRGKEETNFTKCSSTEPTAEDTLDFYVKSSDGGQVYFATNANQANNATTATTATTATKATQDSAGQQINTTYIKGLSVSGRKVTYTKGDGTTGSFNTQDTTYGAVSSSANGLMTPTLLAKLNGIATGAEVNVNADWNATSGDAMILNKPTIPEVIFETEALDLDLLV